MEDNLTSADRLSYTTNGSRLDQDERSAQAMRNVARLLQLRVVVLAFCVAKVYPCETYNPRKIIPIKYWNHIFCSTK